MCIEKHNIYYRKNCGQMLVENQHDVHFWPRWNHRNMFTISLETLGKKIHNSDFQILDIRQWKISDQRMKWPYNCPQLTSWSKRRGNQGEHSGLKLGMLGVHLDKVAMGHRAEDPQREPHRGKAPKTCTPGCLCFQLSNSQHTHVKKLSELRTKDTRKDQRGKSPKLKQTRNCWNSHEPGWGGGSIIHRASSTQRVSLL